MPFLGLKTSDDYSTLGDVIYEAYIEMGLDENRLNYLCCILPTAPFITEEFLKRAENLFLESSFDSFFPVAKYSYPIWRSLKKILRLIVSIWFGQSISIQDHKI